MSDWRELYDKLPAERRAKIEARVMHDLEEMRLLDRCTYESAAWRCVKRAGHKDGHSSFLEDGECKVERDNCQICEGWSGGVKGNENIVDGITMCDYCSTKVDAYKKLLKSSPVDLQQEAREWREAHATEFWKMSDNGMEFDLDAMLAAFAAHLRGK